MERKPQLSVNAHDILIGESGKENLRFNRKYFQNQAPGGAAIWLDHYYADEVVWINPSRITLCLKGTTS